MQRQWQCQYEFSKCDASIRIKRALDKLNTIQSNHSQKSNVELEKEANELIHNILINNQYSNTGLMNDFYHIKYNHNTHNDANQFDAFHDYLCDNNDILECDITHCPSAKRYFDRRQHIACIPFQDKKEKALELDSFTLNLLSRIHTDLIHSQDIHKYKNNNTKIKYIETSIDCNDETLLLPEQNNNELKPEPSIDITQNISEEIDSEGVEFWYWEKHKESKRYIVAMHESLKEEILNLNPMTISIWDALHKECELLLHVNDIKQITSNGHNAKIYDINDGDTITLQHVLSIKLYTDCASLCNTFCDAFRLKKNNTEHKESLTNKNCKIANWARLLTESVQSYGAFRVTKTKYFRGICATEFTFKQFITRYNVPLSTTYDLNQAKELSEDYGMIMVLTIYDAYACGLDTFKLSAYPQDREVLFFGATLELTSVHQYCHNTWRNYKVSDFISNSNGKHSVQSSLANGDFLAEINHKPYWNRKSAEPTNPARQTLSMQKLHSVSRMHDVDIKNLIPLTVSRFIEYHTEKTGDPELIPPQRWDFNTVAMFADVSGFTALSEHLAKAGAGGAEKLAFYLNRYLEQLANKVRKEGGDILQYAGDAIIIVWPPDLKQLSNDSRLVIERKERIARAVKAARAIQNEFHMAAIIPDAITLSVKIGIGYGASSLLFVGGQFGRIEYLLCGSAIKQAFDCEGFADAGDVVISTEAYKYVKEKYVSGYPIKKGRQQKPVAYKVKLEQKKYRNKVSAKGLESNDRYLISEYLKPFVPRAAWQRLVKRFKAWHAEQRAVTVLFINLDFNYDNCDDANLESVPQDLLQRAVQTTQKCIYKYKGSLNKFLFDDKGSTVIAVFGLPPIANFDDCTRAVLAALFIEEKMRRMHIRARIGVTTGRVYVGLVGASGSASEYGILGDQVNLAARLMTHVVKKQGGEGVIVSNTTYKQAKECINIKWQRLQSTSVKGFSREFIIWRPRWRPIRGDLSMKRNRFFIGWKETMHDIVLKLKSADNNGFVCAIHADHWGGATHFARELLHEIQSSIYVVGTTNLAFNDCDLFAWKALLCRLVRECRILRGDKFQISFTRFMCDTGGESLVKYLAVLNELLDTQFAVTSADVDVLRYRVEIICHLLRQVSKYSTMVLLISQLQYMSLGDWSITQAIANHINAGNLCDVSLVLAGWSMDTASLTYLVSAEEKQAADNFARIRKICAFEYVLANWTKQEVREFLKFEFEIEIASKKVLHFLMNKSSGIPGMIKCLVHDENLLFLKHGRHLGCTQIERCRDIQSGSQYSDINLAIPYAIQSYYTKMLDSLDQFALLTIKCAAAIAVGQEFLSVSFSYDMLFSCHPLNHLNNDSAAFNSEFDCALALLEKDRFIYKKRYKLTKETISFSNKNNNDINYYVFASGYLRDVTYCNMLYKQRSQIHKRVQTILDDHEQSELVANCIRRHHLLSLHDGLYVYRDEVERKREEILASNPRIDLLAFHDHHAIWSFPQCCFNLYISDIFGLPETIKASSYIAIHISDDRTKPLTQSTQCCSQYLCCVLSETILQQIQDDKIGAILTMRLWYKQNYRAPKSIATFTLRLRELYEKQLSQEMLSAQHKTEVSENKTKSISQHASKRNSLNTGNINFADHTDLFVGYKMNMHVKQKKIERFHLDKPLYIESFLRFCAVDDASKMQTDLHTVMPFAADL